MKKIVFRIFTLLLCAVMIVPSRVFLVKAADDYIPNVDIEIPGGYVGGEEEQNGQYKSITLSVPFYCQRHYGDCGISSIAMVEAYKKGYGQNDTDLYNSVWNYNGASNYLESYSKLGYTTISKDLASIYEQLQHDNPVIVYRTGNGLDHYSVVYGYNGSTTKLEAKGFLVLNTYHNSSYGIVGPGSYGYTNLETWLSGATWTHAMIRNADVYPIADKTSGGAKFNQVWAHSITETDARIEARMASTYTGEVGFYFGTSQTNMTKITEQISSPFNVVTNGYTFSQWWDEPLNPGTNYYYQFYVVSNGQTLKSKIYSFTTVSNSTPEATEKYTVTFKDYDGAVLSSAEYENGATVVVPEAPVREADSEYTYEFTGWDKEVVTVNGDAVYTAQYKATAIPVNTATATVGSSKGRAGETVTVDITVKNADKVGSLAIADIVYNSHVLELVSFEWKVENTVLAHFDSATGMGAAAFNNDEDVNGVIGTLTFKIKDSAADGDYAVSCDVEGKIGVSTYEIYDVAGVVTVYSVVGGDATGDDVVTKDDAIYILMYTFFETQYPANQDFDFNKDGTVTKDDAIYVLMYTFFPDTYPLG